MENKTLKDIRKKYSEEITIYLENFGKGNNRDIDVREKSTITSMPMVMESKIKKEAIKLFKDKYNPNGNTITDKEWLEFFNITEEDLTKLNDGNDGIPPKPKDLGILPTII